MSDSKLPSLAQSLMQSIQATQARLAQAGGDGEFQFLKLEKSGNWVFGADDTEVGDDSLWAIDPNSLMTGYIAWPEEGEPVGEEMASIMDAPIQKGNLPDVGEKWMEQIGFSLRCIEGVDIGVQASYKSTSLGGRKAFKALLDVILERAKAEESDLVPLVFLAAGSYKHKKYGKIYTPDLDVAEWSNHAAIAVEVAGDGDGDEAEAEALPDPEAEKKAKAAEAKAKAKAKKEAEEKEAEKDAPAKKRTRRSRKS